MALTNAGKKSRASKLLSFKDFDLKVFKEEKKRMEDFRKDITQENMHATWSKIRDMYLPSRQMFDRLLTEYTVDPDGTSTPNRLFMMDQDDERLDLEEPLVAIKVHTALSILTQKTPQVRWDSDNDFFHKRAEVLNALRNQDWDDLDTRQQYIMLWFYFVMYGTTYWRRFYHKVTREVFLPSSVNLATDEVEFEKSEVVEKDLTEGEALSPFDVLIDPATQAMKPSSMRKCIYKKVVDFNTFHTRFKDIVPKKNFEEIEGRAVAGYQGDIWVELEFYENMDLDLFYVVANDKELLKDHLPQNHKHLSVAMAIWMPRKDPRNPFGVGPIEMMLPDKMQLDKFKSMTLTQMKFSIYKAIFYTGALESEGQNGDIRIRPDRAYKVTSPKDITFFDMPGPGADAYQNIEFLRGRVDEASGINKPLGGEIVKTTAFQTDLAKDAALARLVIPINNIVMLLEYDAMLTFELQKQFMSLPDVKELVEPNDIQEALDEMQRGEATGNNLKFDLFVDTNEETGEPQVFKADFRSAQLEFETDPMGNQLPSFGRREVLLTPDLFDWKGKVRIVQDSLFSFTPTIDRTKKLEMFNLLIPLFSQPPQLVAKAGKEIVRLYGEDPEDILPQEWLQFLAGVQDQTIAPPPTPGGAIPEEQPLPGDPNFKRSPGRPKEFAPRGREALKFEQQRAPKVVSNIGGQKDLISSQSEKLSP